MLGYESNNQRIEKLGLFPHGSVTSVGNDRQFTIRDFLRYDLGIEPRFDDVIFAGDDEGGGCYLLELIRDIQI